MVWTRSRVDHNNAKNLDLLRIIWKYFVHFFCLVLPIKSDFFISISGRLLHAVFADFAVLIELVPKVSSLQSLSHFYRPFSNKRIWLKFRKFKVWLHKLSTLGIKKKHLDKNESKIRVSVWHVSKDKVTNIMSF